MWRSAHSRRILLDLSPLVALRKIAFSLDVSALRSAMASRIWSHFFCPCCAYICGSLASRSLKAVAEYGLSLKSAMRLS